MRSKDGGMTNFEWDTPTDDEGNLVLYAHTFASSLEGVYPPVYSKYVESS